MPNYGLFSFAAALSLSWASCSSMADVPSVTPDLSSAPADLGTHPDLATPPTVACELPYEQRLIDAVAQGTVTVAPDGAGFVAEIDATAGGSAEAQKNPYVYLDLITGKKVNLTDVHAQKSSTWDIAFKRWQIKINSGDSGPGGVKTATVPSTELPQVTTAPASGYVPDHYFDDKCHLELDANGGPNTALSTWYAYDINTHQLSPMKQVYVMNRRDGKGSIKLQVTSYYKGAVSAYFTIRWGFLALAPALLVWPGA